MAQEDNPGVGRGDPHHEQYDDLKLAIVDAVMDFVIALATRVTIVDEPAEGDES